MSKELAIVLPTNALEVYSCDGIEDMISKIEKHARSIAPDLSTDKGRKAVASNAAQVSRSKTALDALGKDLVSGWKEKAKAVDVERKLMRDRLDSLRDEVRQPLNDWEYEQKAIAIAKLRAAELLEDHAEALEDNVYFDRKRDLDRREAAFAKEAAEHQAMLDAEEAERLEKVRVEREAEAAKQAEIEQAAHDKRIAEEAAQAAKDEAAVKIREAEERVEQEKRAAMVAEEKAKFAKEQAEREVQQAIKDAQEKADYEARVAKEAQARRDANTRNVGKKRKQAKEDLIALVGLTEEQAKEVVLAICNGKIANVSIKY